MTLLFGRNITGGVEWGRQYSSVPNGPRGENRKRGEIRGKVRDPLFEKCPHLFVIGCNVYSASNVIYMYVIKHSLKHRECEGNG